MGSIPAGAFGLRMLNGEHREQHRYICSPVITSGKSGLEMNRHEQIESEKWYAGGRRHLCRNCSNGQFTVGYRESEVLVICTNSSPALRVLPRV